MKKILRAIAGVSIAMTLVASAWAAGGGIAWDKAPKKTTDLAAVQNGAKIFANYCLSCHSAAYMRYNRLQDIGLTEAQIKDNLLFAGDKVGDNMVAAINPKDAKQWFGKNPPDLTLVARSRSAAGQGTGADYIYTLFRNYYVDDTKPTGWDNLAFPSIGMPHVLWELQGTRKAVFEETVDAHGEKHHAFKGFEQLTPGTMTPAQYDNTVADLTAFMQWMAEPAQNKRVRIGVWVMLFLLCFTFIAWRLNAAYWKDIR